MSRPHHRSALPAAEHERACSAEALHQAALLLVSPEAHADDRRIDAAGTLLRRYAPVYWLDEGDIRPFWAVTRYADVLSVERRPHLFSAAPRTLLTGRAAEAALCQRAGKPQLIRGLIQMDRPDHSAYRALAQPNFSREGLARFDACLAEIAARVLDAMADRGGYCDFAEDVAAPFARCVMTQLLGVPEADGPLLQKLARCVVAPNDPLRCGAELPTETIHSGMLGFRDYFMALVEDRRTQPREDLATALATATLDNASLPFYELISYYVLLTTAGFDSTEYLLTGGLFALIEAPDEFERLRREPQLLESAIDEMLRWISPARSILRTALEQTEIGGVEIGAGEAVAVFFHSANRDEAVFADAHSFRIDRTPNPHIAFGHGPHHCLGHHLVMMEMRAFFRELLRRFSYVALAGPPRRTRSATITGISSLPLRFHMS
jgi:cytochrome P450